MSSKKSIPVYFILLATLAFFAFRGIQKSSYHTIQVAGYEITDTRNEKVKIVPNKYEKIIRNVMLVLKEIHYAPKKVDDQFSREVFKKYFENLDVSKNIFTQNDIAGFKDKFETNIDNELALERKAEFFSSVGDLYQKRLLEIEPIISQILANPFDFTIDENYNADIDKKPFVANEVERVEEWRKRLKYMTLERLNDLINQNETAKVKKTQAVMEKEAREKVKKVMERAMEGMKKKANTDEYFKIFMNTVTQSFDPHTDYFPPVDQRSFNESMSGSYFGIGAQLKEEDGNIKIGPLTPGSPSEKSGELSQGDILLAVGEGSTPPIDITGYAVQDVVKIIRGKENTEVRLTLKKIDGTIKVVKLIRKKLALEGTFAKSTIIEDNGKKMGLIYLPEFYADFEDPKGRRCAKDVAEEIIKLKQENVEGIILDLRNNGGGSLYDVVQMVGLFIPNGPVVQIKDKKGNVSTQSDPDRNTTLWDGPLTVLVNEFSASASEIFAGAIQDYQRGVVIGSSSTFGKGTVQRQLGLNFDSESKTEKDEYGSLKITLQKFYRISGASTQLKGVTPDIVLPDSYEYLKFREKDNESALSWDEIPKADYNTSSQLMLDILKKSSNERVLNNKTFNTIKNNTQLINQLSDKAYSLKLTTYREEQLKLKNFGKEIDESMKLRDSLPVRFATIDIEKYNSDKDKAENNKRFLQAVSKDIYINEAVKVIGDMLRDKLYAFRK